MKDKCLFENGPRWHWRREEVSQGREECAGAGVWRAGTREGPWEAVQRLL